MTEKAILQLAVSSLPQDEEKDEEKGGGDSHKLIAFQKESWGRIGVGECVDPAT